MCSEHLLNGYFQCGVVLVSASYYKDRHILSCMQLAAKITFSGYSRELHVCTAS